MRKKKRNPSEEEQEKEFFLDHINNNLVEIKKLLIKMKDKISLEEIIGIQRLTGRAHGRLKELYIIDKVPLDLHKW